MVAIVTGTIARGFGSVVPNASNGLKTTQYWRTISKRYLYTRNEVKLTQTLNIPVSDEDRRSLERLSSPSMKRHLVVL